MSDAKLIRLAGGPPYRYAIDCPNSDINEEPIHYGGTAEELIATDYGPGSQVECICGETHEIPDFSKATPAE